MIKLLFSPKKKFYYFLYSTIGYLPRNVKLFEIAFIHKSASIRSGNDRINNERLEFLGDAVLDSIIAEYLFFKYPGESEGFLTKMKAKIVNREQLNYIANQIGLQPFLVAQTTNSIRETHINGNAFEAMVGAVFLDGGYKKTKQFITRKIIGKYLVIDKLETTTSDFKSQLLEWGQKHKIEIIFNTKEGENHTDNKPEFLSEIIYDDAVIGAGSGKSKKEAEQNASQEALAAIQDYNGVN